MKRGVSIMFINGLVVAVVLLFSFGVDVTNRLVHQRYDQTVASQRALIACNNASKVFQQQSDELTLHVNNYVETDSTDALLAYFAIIDNQSREHEIEIAEQYDVDCTTLKQALALSDALAEWEIHAFALMAAARGTIRTAPVQVQEYDVPLLCTVRKPYGAESFDWIDGIIDNTMRIENGYAYPREGAGWGFSFKPEALIEIG